MSEIVCKINNNSSQNLIFTNLLISGGTKKERKKKSLKKHQKEKKKSSQKILICEFLSIYYFSPSRLHYCHHRGEARYEERENNNIFKCASLSLSPASDDHRSEFFTRRVKE